MKALVTGASGFIGSTLIEELGTLGFDVYALTRRTSSLANLEGLRLTRLEGDLGDPESLRQAIRRVPDLDYVFHLAGATAGARREHYFEHNSRGTARLAQVIAEERPGLQRFVHVSSLAAAGPGNSLKPRMESDIEAPVSAYGESKFAGEKELLRFKAVFPITIIRPPMVYGPRDKGVYIVIKTISRNFMPLLPGRAPGGLKYYSAIHSKDLCRGIVQAALAKTIPSGEVFYLAADDVFSSQLLMTTIAEKLGVDPYRFRLPKPALYAAAAAGTAFGYLSKKTFALNIDKLNELLPDYWICSNQKAKDQLGFAAEFTIQTGIANTIDWYKRENWL
jgi:nucleoside-diphosphate-sugar epimerase